MSSEAARLQEVWVRRGGTRIGKLAQRLGRARLVFQGAALAAKIGRNAGARRTIAAIELQIETVRRLTIEQIENVGHNLHASIVRNNRVAKVKVRFVIGRTSSESAA